MEAERITYHPGRTTENAVFSILIPTWNNLRYLKLCVESIKKNSRFNHQIIVHVNEGSDGTLGWDFYLWEEIGTIGHKFCTVSGTKIEPLLTANTCAIAPWNFGLSVEDFREKELLEAYAEIPFADWCGSKWYPLAVHRNLWNLVGGLSVEFTPGMYSDPDFMMKLWHAGVRYFKGISKSRSYHFISRSVRRVKKNNGRRQFLRKWGISNSTFAKYYLHMGEPFQGYLMVLYLSDRCKCSSIE